MVIGCEVMEGVIRHGSKMLYGLLDRPPLIYLFTYQKSAAMAGPNRRWFTQIRLLADNSVEVFKFGCYVFFPILAMLKFGDPEW